MDADGGNVVAVTEKEMDAYAPDWSPDGAYLAFHIYDGGDAELFITSMLGIGERQLTENVYDDIMADFAPLSVDLGEIVMVPTPSPISTPSS